jgi:hypothetical protein
MGRTAHGWTLSACRSCTARDYASIEVDVTPLERRDFARAHSGEERHSVRAAARKRRSSSSLRTHW